MQLIHLLLDSDQLVGEALLDVGSLHSQHRLEGVLFASQDLNFLLVIIQLVRNVLDLLLRRYMHTSSVWSLPFREAGLLEKLCPVSL